MPTLLPLTPKTTAPADHPQTKCWVPRRVLVTDDAWALPHTRQILDRIDALDIPVQRCPGNRLSGLRGKDDRETYRIAKQTLAIVTAPPSQFKLQPIPPSADWQFHLAQGCPAHCQYCYLAGSLSGPPVTRVYGNLPQILDNLVGYAQPEGPTTYEVSCYTDPLGIEHLTGSLSMCIEHFGRVGAAADMSLRWVSKFDAVDGLLALPHGGRTQCRFSVNADTASAGLEGGTASRAARLDAAARLAAAGYAIGFVIAPIMPTEEFAADYSRLLDEIAQHLGAATPMTFELITHRFTPQSRKVLQQWYPATRLDLSDRDRAVKRNKFGGQKFVYRGDLMQQMRSELTRQIADRFSAAEVLYWT